MKKKLNKLVGSYVSVHNANNKDCVFIVWGCLKKEQEAFVVRAGLGYVSFNNCKGIRKASGSMIPQIWV